MGEVAPTKAVAPLERAIDLYRRLGDAPWLIQSLLKLGVVLALMEQFERATLVFAEAFPLVERLGLRKVLAGYFKDVGGLKVMTGDIAGASGSMWITLSLYGEGVQRLEAAVACA